MVTEGPPGRMVLVVEDEPKLAQILIDYLAAEGYLSHWLRGGCEVVPWVRRHAPDLILLDVMLPGRNGMEVCRDLREFSSVPILMVTARIEEVDRLSGLELGADDYVCKPFSPREVMARIKAVLRRMERTDPRQRPGAGLSVDQERLEIRLDGKALGLTASEFRLLGALVARRGRVLTREQLLDCLHEDGRAVTDRTVDSHIKNIRRKISEVFPDRELVVSVYGVGYKAEW